MGDVAKLRPDAPAPDTVTVVSTFGPDGIDMTAAFRELYDRLGHEGLADVLQQGAEVLRGLAPTTGAA